MAEMRGARSAPSDEALNLFERAILWLWRHRPPEGWSPLLLLLAAAGLLAGAVIDREWVPEVAVVAWAAVPGVLAGSLLGRRARKAWLAWAILLAYGLAVPVIYLARLWPFAAILFRGWAAASGALRQSWGLFADRVAGWLTAVQQGGRSEETIVFTLGLGAAAWLLGAYAGWSTYRRHRPLAGLAAIGFALAANGFYGGGPQWPLVLFIGLVAFLAATVHFADLEGDWERRGVDFSGEIRLDLFFISGGVALGLTVLAYLVPAINLRAISRAVLDRPAVHQVEEALGQAFAGVQPAAPAAFPGEGPGPGAGRAGSVMPRSFLLGNPPELAETLVMTAAVSGPAPAGTHWRGANYDLYTGRGWSISEERREVIAAGEPIPLPAAAGQAAIRQRVRWVLGDNATRYTVGLPLRFDQDVAVYWRGVDDLSRVRAQGNDYAAESRPIDADPAALRRARLEDVPPAVLARYTALPDELPGRVAELAREVAGEGAPYDQARALELFLRQYPYSLEVELPPASADLVDFFLFELQTGYCDYYASAMVVMARSLGLPARLAAGFLPQPADDAGFQQIYELNAHSWPELYFAGYGWVEFEPTAPFAPADAPAAPSEAGDPFADFAGPPVPPPIPPPQPDQPPAAWLLALAAALLALWWWRRQRGNQADLDETSRAYGRLQAGARRLGQPTPPSQTPAEFEAALRGRLRAWAAGALGRRLDLPVVEAEAGRLAGLFAARQYGRRPGGAPEAEASWRRIRGRVWLLGLFARLTRAK